MDQTDPAGTDVACPRCGQKLVDPGGLGWCSKCGFCRSLEEDKVKAPVEQAAAKAETKEEAVVSSLTLNEILIQEMGWGDVVRGLGRILLGWGILIGGILLGGLLLIGSLTMGPTIGAMWTFLLGMAIIGVAGLFSYGIMIAGQLVCMINTPERNGARWLIFACLVCLAMGPIINVASYWSFTSKKPDFKKGVAGLKAMELDTTGRYLQAAGAAAGVSYNLCFILYMRAIGCCFASVFLTRLSEVFFAFEALLFGGGLYLVFNPTVIVRHPLVVFLYAGALFVGFIWFLLMIVITRSTIILYLRQVRTPMGGQVFQV